MVTKAPPITAAQFCAFTPPPGHRAELIDGQIIVSPDPKPLHHEVALNIYSLLRPLVEGKPIKVGMRVNFQLKDQNYMPSPDVFLVDKEHWAAAIANNTYPQASPILAVEVISPSNTPERVKTKTEFYLEQGTMAVWTVHLKRELVYEFRKSGHSPFRTCYSGVASIPLPLGLGELTVKDFFRIE
jgi:Uma2 family endonuclease